MLLFIQEKIVSFGEYIFILVNIFLFWPDLHLFTF